MLFSVTGAISKLNNLFDYYNSAEQMKKELEYLLCFAI